MLRLEEVLQLKDGEDVRLIVKRHGMILFPGLFLACLFIVMPFFFLFRLFSFGMVGTVVFLLLILTGLVIAWRTFVIWDGDALIISTNRLVRVVQTGIFSRTVNEIPLSSILEVSWTKHGIQAYLFNLGTIRILAGKELLIKKIPQPKQLHALIMDLSELAKKSRISDNHLRDHRIGKIQKMLETMDDQALRETERALAHGERVGAIEGLYQDTRSSASGSMQESAFLKRPIPDVDTNADPEVRIKTLFGEDRITRLKLMDE